MLDVKLMVKNFKENKPKILKTNKIAKKSNVKVKSINNKDKDNNKDNDKNKNVKNDNIIVDVSLDTSNTYNIETLEYFTDELIKAFGNPEEIENEDSKYEWKLNVDGDIYSIYDWIENKEKFEDKTWYLAGLNEDIKRMNKINDFIDKKNKIKEEKESEDTVEEETKEESEDAVLNDLFGDEEEEDKKEEINIDDINFDNVDNVDTSNLELDIDGIEF